MQVDSLITGSFCAGDKEQFIVLTCTALVFTEILTLTINQQIRRWRVVRFYNVHHAFVLSRLRTAALAKEVPLVDNPLFDTTQLTEVTQNDATDDVRRVNHSGAAVTPSPFPCAVAVAVSKMKSP